MNNLPKVVIVAASAALLVATATGFRSRSSNAPEPNVALAIAEGADAVAYVANSTAVFAGGCFWGVEAVFEHVRGVTSVVSGYAGGGVVNPDYGTVSSGRTGHAEAVRIQFDSTVVSYQTLLQVFFTVAHNPTELNRQGPDHGTQYRSAVFAVNEAQRAVTNVYIAQLTQAKLYREPIVTQVSGPAKFYVAEDYHQDYLPSHLTQPYIVYNDLPKLDALKKEFPKLWTDRASK